MRDRDAKWGSLAPAREGTARLVLLAGSVGAIAAAGVVFALVDQPATEGSLALLKVGRPVESAQARASVQVARLSAPANPLPQAARTDAGSPAPGQAAVPLPAAAGKSATAATSGSGSNSAPPVEHADPAAATDDTPAKTGADQPAAGKAPAADAAQVEKKAAKKSGANSHYAWRSSFFHDSGRWGGWHRGGWRDW